MNTGSTKDWSNEQLLEQLESVESQISELQSTQRALTESEMFNRTIINSVAQGIIVYDHQLRYRVWNRFMENLTGLSAEDVIGRSAFEIFPHLREQGIDKLLERALNGERVQSEDTHYTIPQTGHSGWVIGTYAPMYTADCDVIGVVGIIHDITDRKLSERGRLELTLERERTNIMKEFIANLSHDLKAPLTVINTNLYLLEQLTDPDRQQQTVDSIRAQIQRLNGLIQDIMTISQLEQAPDLSLETVNLNDIVNDIKDQFIPRAESKNQTVRIELCDDLGLIRVDKKQAQRMVVNLVDNAINYTPEGGQITITTNCQEDRVILRVEDTGIGIAAEDLPYIFNRFYRTEKARIVSASGTGLGLSIVKRIAEVHDGGVEVSSILGEGTTFEVWFPDAV